MSCKMLFLAVVLACCSLVAGQQSNPQEITNSDVIQMTKAGIADDTIILAIKRGPVKFDVSAQGLIALKSAGVSDKVLNVILTNGGTPDRMVSISDEHAAQAIFNKAISALGSHDAITAVHSIR